jgi:hypothetical protein
MTDPQDERQPRSATEEIRLIATRKKAEAEAEQASEREVIKTVGMAFLGMIGLIIALVGALWLENVAIAALGFVAAGVGLGILTVQQGAKLLGRGGNGHS